MQLENGLLGQIEKQQEGSSMVHRRHDCVQGQSDVTEEDSVRPFQDRPLPLCPLPASSLSKRCSLPGLLSHKSLTQELMIVLLFKNWALL